MKKILVALAAAVMLLFSPLAGSFEPYKLQDGSIVYVWTAEEMEVLDRAIGRMVEENKAMKARIHKLEKSCI